MNCSVCGKPLLFNRVAFKCSCGAYVHAYCLDQHILEAHRPQVEEGHVDLNSDFHPVNVTESEATEVAELPAGVAALASGTSQEDEAEASDSAAENNLDEDGFSPGEVVEDDTAEDSQEATDEQD